MNLVDAFNESGIFAKLSLLVGFGPPAVALAYVFHPGERTLAILRPVSLAAIFAGISGLVGGWIVILRGLAAATPGSLNVSSVYMGLSEALAPPFVNFGLLAAAWLLIAIGMTRRPRPD
jgi:hypothetical protein